MTATLEDNATLEQRQDIDATLTIFRIRPDLVPPAEQTWFVPGQYVAIGSGETQRAYSIASEPDERRWLEFYVRYARDPETPTPLTHVLWKMPVGSRLHLAPKIVGRFTLERTLPAGDTRSILMVAAGTGLAPFMSMVRRAVARKDSAVLRRMTVMHGASHPHELAYRDELTAAAASFGLVYVPTISRPTEHPEWQGACGRVEALFAPSESQFGALSPERTVVYVCGFRGTIASTLEKLVGRGFVPEERKLRRLIGIGDDAPPSLFFEQYDTEPVFDLNDTAGIAALRAAVRTKSP